MAFWSPDQVADREMTYRLQVGPECCVGPPDRQFFMGGAGFATAIEALERATDKKLLWANIQFLTQTFCGATVDIDVEVPVYGRNVTQAIATVSEGGRVLHRTAASLGGRDVPLQQQFVTMPGVPDPDDCLDKEADAFGASDNLIGQFERRTALQSRCGWI